MDRELHPHAETGARGADRATLRRIAQRDRQLRRRARCCRRRSQGSPPFIMLKILGVPVRGPLALIIFFFDLIPVVGATIGPSSSPS